MAYSKTLELIEAIVAKLGGTMTGTNISSVHDGLEQILALVGTGSGPSVGTAVGKSTTITQTIIADDNTINHGLGATPISVVVFDSSLITPYNPDWTVIDNNNINISWHGGVSLVNAKIILVF